MYRILGFLFALSLLVSCGQQTKKAEPASENGVISITVDDFLADASPYTGQKVDIQGRVVHVCRHGGQKLFIVGEDGEKRIRITTGKDIAEFDVALEGEKLGVVGIVNELIIDETYLAEWEADVMEGLKHDSGEGHEGRIGQGEGHGESQEEDLEAGADVEQQVKEQLARIQEIRDEIAESSKDHLSDYWIETVQYKIINE